MGCQVSRVARFLLVFMVARDSKKLPVNLKCQSSRLPTASCTLPYLTCEDASLCPWLFPYKLERAFFKITQATGFRKLHITLPYLTLPLDTTLWYVRRKIWPEIWHMPQRFRTQATSTRIKMTEFGRTPDGTGLTRRAER